MRKGLIGLVVFLVLIAAIGVWRQKTSEKVNLVQPAKTLAYQTQINEKGEVGVAVTPLLFSKDSSKFTVVLTTHSVELDYDLKEISILTDDQKNDYKALSWSGGKGGHHLEGTLVFPNISKDAKAVKLTFKKIDSVDRVFSWKI